MNDASDAIDSSSRSTGFNAVRSAARAKSSSISFKSFIAGDEGGGSILDCLAASSRNAKQTKKDEAAGSSYEKNAWNSFASDKDDEISSSRNYAGKSSRRQELPEDDAKGENEKLTPDGPQDDSCGDEETDDRENKSKNSGARKSSELAPLLQNIPVLPPLSTEPDVAAPQAIPEGAADALPSEGVPAAEGEADAAPVLEASQSDAKTVKEFLTATPQTAPAQSSQTPLGKDSAASNAVLGEESAPAGKDAEKGGVKTDAGSKRIPNAAKNAIPSEATSEKQAASNAKSSAEPAKTNTAEEFQDVKAPQTNASSYGDAAPSAPASPAAQSVSESVAQGLQVKADVLPKNASPQDAAQTNAQDAASKNSDIKILSYSNSNTGSGSGKQDDGAKNDNGDKGASSNNDYTLFREAFSRQTALPGTVAERLQKLQRNAAQWTTAEGVAKSASTTDAADPDSIVSALNSKQAKETGVEELFSHRESSKMKNQAQESEPETDFGAFETSAASSSKATKGELQAKTPGAYNQLMNSLKDLVEKLPLALKGSNLDAKSSFSMDLDIQGLGHVKLQMEKGAERIGVSLQTSNESSKEQLANQRQDIERELKSLGYKDVSVDVGSQGQNYYDDARNGRKTSGGNAESEENVKLAFGDPDADLAEILAMR